MAKHLLVTLLNFQGRKKDDPECVDKNIDFSEFGLGETSVRDIAKRADDWLQASSFSNKNDRQTFWTVEVDDEDIDGEPLKDVLDAFNNRGLEDLNCGCD